MYDESPKLYFITVLVGMGLFVGLILGIIWTWDMQENKTNWIVIWIVLGGAVFLWISNWFINRREKWAFYEWETTNNLPTQSESTAINRYLNIQIWIDKTTSQWIKLGLTDDEWRYLAVSVHESQMFSTDTVDRKWYAKVKQRFEEVGLIIPGGRGGGYKLTASGKNVFKHLATIPYPYADVPGLIKELDPSPAP